MPHTLHGLHMLHCSCVGLGSELHTNMGCLVNMGVRATRLLVIGRDGPVLLNVRSFAKCSGYSNRQCHTVLHLDSSN